MTAAADHASAVTLAPPVSAPAAPRERAERTEHVEHTEHAGCSARTGHGARTKAELLATISASRLGMWLGCRLKFFFRHVLGIQRPATPARHVGSVVHAVLQQWNLARWRRAPLAGQIIESVFNQAWATREEDIQWAEDEPEDKVKTSALGLLRMYLRDTPIPEGERPEGVEVRVEKDLASHGLPTLIGIIDLVRAGGRIVDFKTTGKTPNSDLTLHTHEVQLTAYAMLYREATDRRETALELHHLVKLKTPKLILTEAPPATERQITRLLRLIESHVRSVQSEDYAPAPGIGCASCEFLDECKRWS